MMLGNATWRRLLWRLLRLWRAVDFQWLLIVCCSITTDAFNRVPICFYEAQPPDPTAVPVLTHSPFHHRTVDFAFEPEGIGHTVHTIDPCPERKQWSKSTFQNFHCFLFCFLFFFSFSFQESLTDNLLRQLPLLYILITHYNILQHDQTLNEWTLNWSCHISNKIIIW